MSAEKKERVGVLMPPTQVKEIDALYPLHGHASRSEFICAAASFYYGYLNAGSGENYMSKTVLSFLEDKLGKLEARICRQLFRMCVELAMVENVTACQIPSVTDELLADVREQCVKEVKDTVGNIRYDRAYACQHGQREQEGTDEM